MLVLHCGVQLQARFLTRSFGRRQCPLARGRWSSARRNGASTDTGASVWPPDRGDTQAAETGHRGTDKQQERWNDGQLAVCVSMKKKREEKEDKKMKRKNKTLQSTLK